MWKPIFAGTLLLAGLASAPGTARTMMEYGSMPMRSPEDIQQTQPQDIVRSKEAPLRSVQEIDSEARAKARLRSLGDEHDQNDNERVQAPSTGISTFYWLLGGLALLALLAVAYSLGLRQNVPSSIRR